MKAASAQDAHVVVVGAGFGGYYAAKRLASLLPSHARITLVDRNNYLLYTPMMTEAAGRSVSPKHIQAPVSHLPRRIRFVQGELTSADLHRKTITLASGETLQADHLLLALGSTTNYRDIEGAEQNTLTMKTLEDVRRVRTLAQRHVELASVEKDLREKKRLLTFLVAGGGYTGVETIAALNDLVEDTAEEHRVGKHELNLILIEPAKRIMAELPEDLAAYTREQLERDGIRVDTGKGVEKVEPRSITLSDGERIEAGMVIWDAGIETNPLIASFDCPKGKKGGISVDSAFRVRGMPGAWAIGDCAEIPKPDGSGRFFEPTAQNATREGTHVAENILATLEGRSVRAFRYKQVGELAVISRYKGVAFVFGIKVSGFPAWLLWRAIYIAKMPNMRQRLGILSDYLRLAIARRLVPTEWRLAPARSSAQARRLPQPVD